MSEIQTNNKLATVSYLAKVLTPIVTAVKSMESKVENVSGLPEGGTSGQVLVKGSDSNGDVMWVDFKGEITEDLRAYIDEQIKMVEPDNIDDGEI